MGFWRQARVTRNTLARFERHTASVPLKVDEYVEKIVKFAKQYGGGTNDTERIFELAIAAYKSGSRGHWSWGYSIVPHLDYSTARSLIRQSLGLETEVPTKTDQVELDLSNLRIVDQRKVGEPSRVCDTTCLISC
jgi:hypothetical protein